MVEADVSQLGTDRPNVGFRHRSTARRHWCKFIPNWMLSSALTGATSMSRLPQTRRRTF